jgi:hypothetical protein
MPDNTDDFDAMFGDMTHNPGYTDRPTSDAQLLPVPLPTDNLPTLVRKWEALAELVETGKSVAVYTGYKTAAQQVRDPEQLAKKNFTPLESKQYDAWKAGAIMNQPDWANCHGAAVTGTQATKRMTDRTNALRIIYRNDDITLENYAWVHTNMAYLLPLIVAVSKIQAAERELQGGQEELTPNELAEIQAIHKINAVAMKRINDIGQEINRLNRRGNAARETLQAREHAIKAKLQG